MKNKRLEQLAQWYEPPVFTNNLFAIHSSYLFKYVSLSLSVKRREHDSRCGLEEEEEG